MKKIIKYQMVDVKNGLLAFYGIYIAMATLGTVVAASSYSGTTVINGFEFAEMIFSFVMGISLFKEYYWMAVQNSISRKSFYKGCVCTMVISSIALAILGQILLVIFNAINSINNYISYRNIVELIYKIPNSVSLYLLNLIFCIMIYTTLFLVGYFIALIFYKANKICKILIAAGIPVILFMILPIVLTSFSTFRNNVITFFMTVFGITSGNPIYGIVLLLGISIIIGSINYPIIKRTQVG